MRYVAPEGYFESLPARIKASILDMGPAKVVSMKAKWGYASRIAASLGLLLLRSAALRYAVEDQALVWEDIPTENLLSLVVEENYDEHMILEVMEGGNDLPRESMNKELDVEDWSPDDLDQLLDEIDLEDLEAAWLEGEELEG